MVDKEVILEVKNIAKSYGHLKALKDVSFKLRKKEVLGIIGDNGAGKSTLLKILRGAIKPTSGEILLKGKKTEFESPMDATKAGIQCVYQNLALVDCLTVSENFFLGREISKRFLFFPYLAEEYMENETKNALKRIEFEEIDPNETVDNLSGGQRQAVAVARTIFSEPEPEIILLDEPTSALSEKGKQMVFRLVGNLKEKYSFILVTHDLPAALKVCDYIIILKLGEIVYESKVTEDLTLDEIISLM